jgi:polysaccharide biosynthesis/export protein
MDLNMKKPLRLICVRGFFLLCISVLFFCLSPLTTAQTQAQVQEAKAKLSTMTPDEIEAAIRRYGMTRDEAEARAKAVGIDLESYLKSRSAEPAQAPSTQVNIQLSPTTQTASPKQMVSPDTSGGQSNGPSPAVQAQAPVVQPTLPAKPPQEAPPVIGPGGLEYFGYNLFRRGGATFEIMPNLTDNNYIIGKGDVLRISFWGDVQSSNDYSVDIQGRIVILPAGPIMIAGYTLEQAKARVIQALSRSISGLIAKPPTTSLDVSISQLRPIRAFMLGEVANPGTYSLTSFATVFNALFTVGGPLMSGSLRNVRLMRNGKLETEVDLYDYLIGSEKTKDIRINDNDVIYVPLRNRTVGIRGAVLRSAYFELKPKEQLQRLLDFSGGIKNTFYLQRIQINRILPFSERKPGDPERKIFDIDFSQILQKGKDFNLEDGDIVTIYSISDEEENYVDIAGAVWRPGRYQLERVPTLNDLLVAADSLMPEAYMDRATIVRTYDDKTTEVFHVNLDSIMNKTSKFELESWDNVRIFSRDEMLANQDSISVEGRAKYPGRYPLHEGLQLYDVVYEKVGLTDTLFRKQIFLERADLVRYDENRYTSRIITFNLWDLFQHRINDTVLLPSDRIIIYPINAIQFTDRFADIVGSVKAPGRYRLSENMTVLDLLIQAGGYSEEALPLQAEISRLERSGIGHDSLTKIIYAPIPDFFDTCNISSQKMAELRASSFRLQHRDEVFIRPNPNYIYQQSVTINGEVQRPGSYVLSKLNEHLTDIVKRAGGIKKAGYARGGKVIRGGTALRIDVAEAIDDPEGNNDIILQGGDAITIPKQPFSVQVAGQVNNPGLFSYVDGKSTWFYLDGSGGIKDSADFILISGPTGMVEKVGRHWWSSNPRLYDGSSIFVTKLIPEPQDTMSRYSSATTYDFIKDIMALLVSSLTVIVLASKL